MTWAPLIVVGAWVLWLRFKVGERFRHGAWMLIAHALAEHGTKTLVNGMPYSAARPPAKPNRAQRRAAR